METTSAAAKLPASRERIQRLSTTRASSRSSTSTASEARNLHQHTDRTTSSMASPASTQRSSHLVHRFQNNSQTSQCPPPSVGSDDSSTRNLGELNTRSSDPKLTAPAVSSYLQEKLIRERKVESERSASRMSNDTGSVSVDARASQSSPVRSPLDRPQSSTGHHTEGSKKKGVSLKEMEQTMTTLHKQNFDLKLELYHRREKQTSLEERCETLETEKRELEELNDKLMSELEMRDKAVEEAVSMIISLEARMEQLLREREMVQQVEKNNMFVADETIRRALSNALDDAAPFDSSAYDQTPTQKKAPSDLRSLNRMPSFVSERSETTENLRNVYLGARGGNSLLSLPRMSEDFAESDVREAINRMGSPNLSVLSESSFLSIYGRKNDHESAALAKPESPRHASPSGETDISAAEPPPDIGMDSSNASPAAIIAHALASTAPPTITPSSSRSMTMTTTKSSTPTKNRRSGSFARSTSGSGPYTSLTEMVGTSSPLQRLERMDMQPSSNSGQTGGQNHTLRSSEKQSSRQQRKIDDVLRPVRTDALFARDLNNAGNLPPTPDTISTYTLHRYKNSNETLSQGRSTSNDRSFVSVKETPDSASSGAEKQSTLDDAWDDSNLYAQPPSTTAFDSRRQQNLMAAKSNFTTSRLDIPRRPRSADETTISHHGRSSGWGDSDSSDDDLDGNDSASLHDFWLRESLRPSGQGRDYAQEARSRRPGRISPDLFHFPATSNGWATTAMFGSLRGQGYLGSGPAPLANTLDALGDSLPTPVNGTSGNSAAGLLASPISYGVNGMPTGPPPPPNRRSSLHAQTGTTRELAPFGNSSRTTSRHGPTTPITPTLPGKRRKPKTRDGDAGESTPANKYQESAIEDDTPPQHPPLQKDQTNLSKKRYPPTSGSFNSGSRSNRVLSLFRRSGSHEVGSASVPDTPVAPPTATSIASANSAKSMPVPAIGVPSRARREDLQDDNEPSATPPPIMRNPRAQTSAGGGGGSTTDYHTSSRLQSVTGYTTSREGSADIYTPTTAPPVPQYQHQPTATQAAAKPAQPDISQPVQPQQAQGSNVPTPDSTGKARKKWLGLGRVTGLQNRAG